MSLSVCLTQTLRSVLLKKTIQRLLLANSKFSRLNTRMVYPKKGVNVVHRLCTNISKLFDLGGGILDLKYLLDGGYEDMERFAYFSVGELKTELLYTRLDGIPSSETVAE